VLTLGVSLNELLHVEVGLVHDEIALSLSLGVERVVLLQELRLLHLEDEVHHGVDLGLRTGADDLGEAGSEREFEALALVEVAHVVHALALDQVAFVVRGLFDLFDCVQVDHVQSFGDLVPARGQDVESGAREHLLERVFVGDVHEAHVVLPFAFLCAQFLVLLVILVVDFEFLGVLGWSDDDLFHPPPQEDSWTFG